MRSLRPIDSRVQPARRLRRDMTEAEQKLWRYLRQLPRGSSHFRRQATIGPYFADFACHTQRLIIEVDGGQHNDKRQAARDADRTAYLQAHGYRVLRFWNHDVLSNIEGVMTVIYEAITDPSAPPTPTPPRHSLRSRGEGRRPPPTPDPSPQGGGGRREPAVFKQRRERR
jgi:very-short-patch-repair endonuclease